MFILGMGEKKERKQASKKGLLSFGIQHRCKSTEASQEHVVSIFMVEEQAKQETRAMLNTCLMLVSCLDCSSNLNIEATCSSKMWLEFQWTTRHISGNRTIQNQLREPQILQQQKFTSQPLSSSYSCCCFVS
jgi:hypothetical protein